MEYAAQFPEWLAQMIEIHVDYVKDQSVSLLKIAVLDAKIFWCDVKIFFYS